MNCAEVIRQIPLYSYGEISSDAEEKLEAHFAICENCKAELARHRSFLEVLDERDEMTDPALLASCRLELRSHLLADKKEAAQTGSGGTWSHWIDRIRHISEWHIPMRIPVGALALVALGWLGARYTPEKFGGIQAQIAPEPMFSNVRSVEPDPSGRVQIAVDEIRRRVVSGNMEDPRIQSLLLSAAREEANPGVRVESIGILKDRAESSEVRGVLLEAALHDPNAGVRLKALEGLKPYASDAAVRKTLADVLLKDDNPGVRVQAIDLLTSHRDDSIVGVLQDVVQKEDNTYVRTRCRNLLQEMKASVGTY
jgi:HEAT repeats/Putative zinc-finger